MCLSTEDNALVIGSQTARADGNVSIFNFASGFKTAISGKGMYYPNGDQAQRLGVKLDIEVSPTILGLRQNKR